MCLSARQAAILKYIEACEIAPRHEEIADAVGLRAASAVQYQVNMLIKKGYLRPRPKGMHRALSLTEKALAAV